MKSVRIMSTIRSRLARGLQRRRARQHPSSADLPGIRFSFRYISSIQAPADVTRHRQLFRPRHEGPEADLEDRVALSLDSLLPDKAAPSWVAGSLRLGGGMPDLMIATFRMEIMDLAKPTVFESHILACLRTISGARPEMLAARMRQPEEVILERLNAYVSAKVVRRVKGAYFLRSEWKQILPVIISVEVKVSAWKRGLLQAARNSLFSHYSYLAVPSRLAERLAGYSDFKKRGIGLLSVGEDSMRIAIVAPKRTPVAWAYYYKLAFLVAQRMQANDAV